MGADEIVQILRHLLIEALIVSSPVLVSAALVGLLFSLIQTLTGIQEQTLTAVPRLVIVFLVSVAIVPWCIHRIVTFTFQLWTGFERHLG